MRAPRPGETVCVGMGFVKICRNEIRFSWNSRQYKEQAFPVLCTVFWFYEKFSVVKQKNEGGIIQLERLGKWRGWGGMWRILCAETKGSATCKMMAGTESAPISAIADGRIRRESISCRPSKIDLRQCPRHNPMSPNHQEGDDFSPVPQGRNVRRYFSHRHMSRHVRKG